MDPHDHEQRVAGYLLRGLATERILADIWQKLLGVDRVGRQENFFALGGHSILAARAFAEIDRRLHQKISLSAFFGATNLELLPTSLKMNQSSDPAVVIVPVQTRGHRAPLFLMPTMSGAPSLSAGPMAVLGWTDDRFFRWAWRGLNAPWGDKATLAGNCRLLRRGVRTPR